MNPVTTVPEAHEPSPQFRAHLEWQIASALRRESRFDEPVRHRWGSLSAVVMVLVAFALGGMAVAASEQVQDARQKDRLIESVSAQEAMLKMRLDLARAEVQQAQRRVEVGMLEREKLLEIERQAQAIQALLAKLRLDKEEVSASAAPPRDDLDAPLVNGRDFVRERLLVEMQIARNDVAVQEALVAQAVRRLASGITTKIAMQQLEAELEQALSALRLLQGKIELRERALKGGMKPEEAARAQRQLELKISEARLQMEIELSRKQLQEMRRMVETGVATQIELKRVELQLLEKEVELQTLRRTIETLGKRE